MKAELENQFGIRVGIVGAQGTGKSSLAHSIHNELRCDIPELVVIEEVARTAIKQHNFATIDDMIKAGMTSIDKVQASICVEQVRQEISNLGSIISDRTMLDCAAYCVHYKVSERLMTYVMNQMYGTMQHYDLIIYCPIPKDYVCADDEFRLIDPESAKSIDIIIFNLLDSIDSKKMYPNLHIKRLGKNRDKWLSKSMKIINKLVNTEEYLKWTDTELEPEGEELD
jgi:predicted ATPase